MLPIFFLRGCRRALCQPSWPIAAIALTLVAFKLYALEQVSRDFLQCRWCLSPTSLIHEISFCLVLLLLHVASSSVPKVWLHHLLRSMVVALLALMVCDLAVSYLFWTRLTLADLIKHVPEIGSALSLTSHITDFPALTLAGTLAALVITMVIAIRYLRALPNAKGPHAPILWVCLSVYGCTTLEVQEGSQDRAYHERFTRNVLEVFFAPALEKVSYSDQFAARIAPLSSAEQICLRGQNHRLNVILVVVESLSLFHSQLFSGINDWTPEFDTLAQKGTRYSNFYANGVTTEQGLVALLTGQPPLERGIETASTLFAQYLTPQRSLARDLHEAGYDTAVLTTGNLSFLGKREWLQAIGFDRVEGHDATAYDGLPRYNFDAADDRALYHRTLELVQHQQSPFFVAVETVTTHLPYVDPETGEHSAERVYRYADRALGDFARALERQGYFENGVLLVTGDHRAMVPMARAERTLFGDYGYARVPLAVVGRGITPGNVIATRYSQSDILPSLVHLTLDHVQCLSDHQGLALPDSLRAPTCTFTRRSYDNSEVYVRCDAADMTVQLNGDHTQLASGLKDSALLHTVHRLRLGRGF